MPEQHFMSDYTGQLLVGQKITLPRDEAWAYLPAIEWREDPFFKHKVLPQHTSRGDYAYFTVDEENRLQQHLRHFYEQPHLNRHILRTPTHYLYATVLFVSSDAAGFKVEKYATHDTVMEIYGLTGHGAALSISDCIKVAHTLERTKKAALAFNNAQVFLFGFPDINWTRLKIVVGRLPSGTGWVGRWTVQQYVTHQYDISCLHGFLDDDAHESLHGLGWELLWQDDRFKIGEYQGEDLPEEYANQLESLAEELEEELNAH